ncbi:longevity assurance factor 1 lag1 [Anaeramoeba flamelloides]|uniref:Longevity assurance factor 1 lag1 n=1 Tax=Anaeramoeba flamelloides TaxID=1746091 RepID=A0AAV7Y539_9EUKA|nr:longevity assurance factor 1 lag1 [Anaeramoeba flamelloides]KAJ6255243.1 longevity assurance factor 1 lag1 [Anaeramoeba flamelloides]
MYFDYTNLFFYKQPSGLYKYGLLDLIQLAIMILFVWGLRKFSDQITAKFLTNIPESKHMKFRKLTFQGFFRTITILILCSSFYSRGLLKFALFPWIDMKFLEKYPTEYFTFAGKFIYMFEISYVFVMAPLVPKLEHGKGVYLMLLHHLVTATTVFYSYIAYQTLYGQTIFLVNDLGVVLLYFSKIVNYLGYSKPAKKLFVSLYVVWVIFRGFSYPCHAYSGIIMGRMDWEEGFLRNLFVAISGSALALLEVMQIVWTVFLTRMVYRLIKTGKVDGDIRSDNEDILKKRQESRKALKKAK